MIRISQTSEMRRAQRDLVVLNAVQTAVKSSGTARLATIARQSQVPSSPVSTGALAHGAAGYAQTTRALLIHTATSPVRIASICSECCGEAIIIEEYLAGIGRFRVRICQKKCCGWRDDYNKGLGLIAGEPAIPEGKGSLSRASTLAYAVARLAVLGGSAHIGVIIDPIGKMRNHRRYQAHNRNLHDMVQTGILIREPSGLCRLAPGEGGVA